jgi:hypothetical protein
MGGGHTHAKGIARRVLDALVRLAHARIRDWGKSSSRVVKPPIPEGMDFLRYPVAIRTLDALNCRHVTS